MRLPICLCVSLLAMASCSLAKGAGHSPCDLRPTQTGWHVFIDYQDRFCFEYPPQYRAAPAVFAPGVSTGSATRFVGRLTTKPSPTVVASANDEEEASILIFAYGSPFRPKDLTKFAPTGLEDTPPQPIHAAHGEFYYYGAGGGGVDYPDQFHFGLRGRSFSIEFYGPYSGDKTPAPETKRIEPKVLASFRSF
jgi:hypothetical protein